MCTLDHNLDSNPGCSGNCGGGCKCKEQRETSGSRICSECGTENRRTFVIPKGSTEKMWFYLCENEGCKCRKETQKTMTAFARYM